MHVVTNKAREPEHQRRAGMYLAASACWTSTGGETFLVQAKLQSRRESHCTSHCFNRSKQITVSKATLKNTEDNPLCYLLLWGHPLFPKGLLLQFPISKNKLYLPLSSSRLKIEDKKQQNQKTWWCPALHSTKWEELESPKIQPLSQPGVLFLTCSGGAAPTGSYLCRKQQQLIDQGGYFLQV